MEHDRSTAFSVAAALLLVFMAILAGGAGWRESITIDEVAHIGAGVSYLQKLDLRLNEEHPPLPKILAAMPLLVRGAHADYSHISWRLSEKFFPAYVGQWVFGAWVLTKWNDPFTTLALARAPMLLLTLVLGWALYAYARRLGGSWAGLLCLSIYVSAPAFLAFGPIVHTDLAVTLFSLLTLWRFAETWQDPSRKNAALFGLGLAGGLLSKFTAGILFFAFAAFALSTRWRPLPGQPTAKPEARAWRRLRWRATLRGILWAALAVYAVYFVFSLNQSTDALDRLGHGAAAVPLRRLLMPFWLYLRGVLMVLITANRPTFILGHMYPHGVWFYFPILFVLKSPLGLLGLLLLAAALSLWPRRRDDASSAIIPPEVTADWRVLWVSLIVFIIFCMLSRLDISIRHFTVPLILLILLLAPLPRLLQRLRPFVPVAARLLAATAGVLTLSCLFTAVHAYPYFFPYINPLSFGRPAYALVNDSNLDWNQSLPEVKRFADQHALQKLKLDEYGFNDPTLIVPQAQVWDCQQPTQADAGQWAVVSANMIMDGHNCLWLMQYPHETLAGGSMYAVHLPEQLPPVGSPFGPPLPSTFRQFAGAPFDLRAFFLDVTHHPDTLPQALEEMQAKFKPPNQPQSPPPSPTSAK
jgi:4-amino-4-deoxy-L-arabinose transferase-like glycosyltransferase